MKIAFFLSMVVLLTCLAELEDMPKDEGANHLSEAFNVSILWAKLACVFAFISCLAHVL